MQNKTMVLVAGIVVIALILGGIVGGVAGIAYQKAQPISIDIDWYSPTNHSANFDTYQLTDTGMITIYPDRNVNYYGVLKSH